jgi:hypothetical protein
MYDTPRILFSLYEEALLSRPNLFTQKKTGQRGFFAMTTFDLSRYKTIRRRTKTHFASVGMTLMVGALGRYFRERQEEQSIPPIVSIMHSLPKPSHPLTKLVNHWNVGLFKNEMGVVDPGDRLVRAERDFLRYTGEGVQKILDWHMPLLGLLPAAFLQFFFGLNFGTGMGFTSVPAYEGEAKMLGKYHVNHMCKVFGLQWQQTGE